ncbi:MAG: hypothetical protein MUF27_13455 [Acidobacteria bacterium]|nr:hypothetical protein [Acidobacteriota bacterium]
MDDEVAFLQVAQVGEEGLGAAPLLRGRRRRVGAEEVGLGEQQRAVVPELDAALERTVGQHDLARRGGPRLVLVGLAAGDRAGVEHLLEPLAPAARAHDQRDGPARGARRVQVARQLVEVAAVGARRAAPQVDRQSLAGAGHRQLGEDQRGVRELRLDRGRLDEQLSRRRERVAAALLPRRVQLLPARGQPVARLLRLPRDERAVEQRRQRDDVGTVERRRPLEAGQRLLEHHLLAVVAGRGVGEQRAGAAHQAVEQVVGLAGADRRLARRQEREAVDARGSALRAGVEAANRFDLVAEQFDPQRRVLLRRPEVEQPAAPGKVARGGDDVHHAVALGDDLARQRVEVDAGPGLDPARPGADRRRAGDRCQQRGRGEDDDQRARGVDQRVEHRDALRGQCGVRREAAVGVGVERRQAQHGDRGRIAQQGVQLGGQRAGAGVVRGDDGEAGEGRARQRGGGTRRGGQREDARGRRHRRGAHPRSRARHRGLDRTARGRGDQVEQERR